MSELSTRTPPAAGVMFVKAEVRDGGVAGKGLFAAEAVRRGAVAGCFTLGSAVATEAEYVRACAEQRNPLMRTGTRYAGRYFTYGNEAAPYTYMNHAFEPSLLLHCGLLVARRDLAAGEELTIDYRCALDDTDVGVYADSATGLEIRGFTAKETLLRTARELIELIGPIQGWDGGNGNDRPPMTNK
jgi:hypothetical protein